jgi:hypothetical protein
MASYVVNGATLTCTLGAIENQLQVSGGVCIGDTPIATINDFAGGTNILSFGPCNRESPPPPCIMATTMWSGGKSDVSIGDTEALLSSAVSLCTCGGVVSIVNDGQC